MRPPVFLTGATGFLGMEVLARLLERGDREVVCLVRAADDGGRRGAPRRRARDALDATRRPTAPASAPIAGDLTSPGLGMDVVERTELAEEVGAVLHCAASISFDLPLEEARAINVEGTREMIGFAREAKALGRLERFLHVSTAYVAGAHPGTFRERQLDAGQEFRNTYEQTKWEAEHLVADADDLAPADRAAEHRHGRVATPAGRRPSTSSTGRCARSRAGCSTRSRRCPTAASTSCPSTTSPTASCTCSTAPRRACSTSSRAATPPTVDELSSSAASASTAPRPELVEPGEPDRAGRRRGLPAVLRHGGRLRRLARPRACSSPPGSAPRAWPTTSAA